MTPTLSLLTAIGLLALVRPPPSAVAFVPPSGRLFPPPQRPEVSTPPSSTGAAGNAASSTARSAAWSAAEDAERSASGSTAESVASPDTREVSRRGVLRRVACASLAALVPTAVDAAATDETAPAPSDDIRFVVTKSDLREMRGGLGLELGSVKFRKDARVVVVKSVAPGSLAEKLGIPPEWIVVTVNGADVECIDTAEVAAYFSRVVQSTLSSPDNLSLILKFRDPARVRSDLGNLPTNVLYCT